MIPAIPIIGDVIKGVGQIADDLVTSDEERLQMALEERKLDLQAKAIDADLDKGQMGINQAEAAHPSVFVAGWRPAIGWIGALAMLYQFVLYPFMVWGWTAAQAHDWVPRNMPAPPVLPADQLWVILSGMLGIAGLRSFDKLKETQTDRVAAK